MLRIGRGLDRAAFESRPYCYTVINTNSPRQLDVPMCQGIMDFAAAGQISVITPFTLSGAMAPVTIAGALTLQHGEALAGMTLAQITRPGAPVVYGSFTSNVDMRSSDAEASTFGVWDVPGPTNSMEFAIDPRLGAAEGRLLCSTAYSEDPPSLV